jgi:hypothetical protein
MVADPLIPRPSSASTRVCEWCAESIPEKALKCPHCTKWRKDIAEDQQQFFSYAIGLLVFLFFGVFVSSVVSGVSSTPLVTSPFGKLGEWHERVVTKSNEMIGGIPSFTDDVRYEFSVRKFLSSFLGWVVITCAVGAPWCGVLACRAGNRLERKTGSRWRL